MDKGIEALISKVKKQTESFDTVVLKEDEAKALIAALEKVQRANASQDDHINQQAERIESLEKKNSDLGGELSRYSMTPGQADQRMCESRAVRYALGFGKDDDNVAPIDLRKRIDDMKACIAELEAAPNGMMQLSNEVAEMKRKCVDLQEQKDKWAALAIALGAKADELESRPLCVKPNGAMREPSSLCVKPLCVKPPDESDEKYWVERPCSPDGMNQIFRLRDYHSDLIATIRASGGTVEGSE